MMTTIEMRSQSSHTYGHVSHLMKKCNFSKIVFITTSSFFVWGKESQLLCKFVIVVVVIVIFQYSISLFHRVIFLFFFFHFSSEICSFFFIFSLPKRQHTHVRTATHGTTDTLVNSFCFSFFC